MTITMKKTLLLCFSTISLLFISCSEERVPKWNYAMEDPTYGAVEKIVVTAYKAEMVDGEATPTNAIYSAEYIFHANGNISSEKIEGISKNTFTLFSPYEYLGAPGQYIYLPNPLKQTTFNSEGIIEYSSTTFDDGRRTESTYTPEDDRFILDTKHYNSDGELDNTEGAITFKEVYLAIDKYASSNIEKQEGEPTEYYKNGTIKSLRQEKEWGYTIFQADKRGNIVAVEEYNGDTLRAIFTADYNRSDDIISWKGAWFVDGNPYWAIREDYTLDRHGNIIEQIGYENDLEPTYIIKHQVSYY